MLWANQPCRADWEESVDLCRSARSLAANGSTVGYKALAATLHRFCDEKPGGLCGPVEVLLLCQLCALHELVCYKMALGKTLSSKQVFSWSVFCRVFQGLATRLGLPVRRIVLLVTAGLTKLLDYSILD